MPKAAAKEPELEARPAGRIPPQHVDIEKSLLGAILISEECLPDITEMVKPEDFYDERHRHIYGAMYNLYERHRPVDLLTVKELRNVGISSHDKYGYSFPLYQVISALSASLLKPDAVRQSCHFHRH